MVAFRMLTSNRENKFESRWEAEDVGGLIRTQFNLDVDGGDFPDERTARLQMLMDFVGSGYRVWCIQKKKQRKDG